MYGRMCFIVTAYTRDKLITNESPVYVVYMTYMFCILILTINM